MSKHNYTQYSNKKPNEPHPNQNVNKPFPKYVVKTDAKPEVKLVEETVETVTLPETTKGVVINCAKLNVREKPISTSDIVYVLDVAAEIEIDMKRSSDTWLHVYTATGAEGYCMRGYVDIRL